MESDFPKDTPEVPREILEEHPALTPELRSNYAASIGWIREHWEELLERGWTWDKVFFIGTLPYPLGLWGIAWFSLWGREDLEIDFTSGGDLTCVLHEPGGDVVQTMRKDLIS